MAEQTEGQGAEIVYLSDLETTLRFRVTDDEDAIEAFEVQRFDPHYDGPIVIAREAYEHLVAKARAAGQGMEAYLKSQLRKHGILPD